MARSSASTARSGCPRADRRWLLVLDDVQPLLPQHCESVEHPLQDRRLVDKDQEFTGQSVVQKLFPMHYRGRA